MVDLMLKLARACRIFGLALIAVGVLGAIFGAVHMMRALSAAGLSESDKVRIQANGVTEALFDLAFGVILGSVVLAVGWFAGRRARRA